MMINVYRFTTLIFFLCYLRGKKLVVFLFSDYEFLCRMYGLSGPSGM